MVFLSVFSLVGCKKFLDEKPSKSFVVASTLDDLQAILDNGNALNLGNYPGLLEARTDDFYIGLGGFNRLTDYDRDIYLFKNESQADASAVLSSWTNTYKTIAVANTILDELEFVKDGTVSDRARIKASALFHRAFGHFSLAQLFCGVYNPENAAASLGIPLKKVSDINEPIVRSSIQQTYDFILEDLKSAIPELPEHVDYLTRPNKASAYALLARVYLSQSNFKEALAAAQNALKYNKVLLDFNLLDGNVAFPIQALNEETLFFAYSSGVNFLHHNRECYIDTALYEQYAERDLRKKIFFKNVKADKYSFKGTYMGFASGSFFVGPTVSEVYLTIAECSVRLGFVKEARDCLNALLVKRWEKGYFQVITENNPERLLEIVIAERRKELIMRGVRWTDLRRLNLDPKFKKNILRKLEGDNNKYELQANTVDFIYKIPRTVVSHAQIEQN